jgi:hypothetical protein
MRRLAGLHDGLRGPDGPLSRGIHDLRTRDSEQMLTPWYCWRPVGQKGLRDHR